MEPERSINISESGFSVKRTQSAPNGLEHSEMFDVAMSSSVSSIRTNTEEHFLLPGQLSSRFMQSLRRVRTLTAYSIHEAPCDDRNNSSFVAGWNVINIIQGIGILGIPYAVKMGGWVAVAMIIITAVVCCYTGQWLVDCLYEVCPATEVRLRSLKAYSCIGEKVWPRFGRQMVTVVTLIEMFGGLTLYIILLATMSSTLMKDIAPVLDIYYCSVICTYATLPFLLITKMSIVSWFSLIAVIGLLASIGTVYAFCLTKTAVMSINNIPPINLTSLPISFGIIVFSYCAHAVFPCIEASMTHPEQYPAMMKTSFSIAAISKALLGLLAVCIFGLDTMQEFTTNMDINIYFSTTVCILVLINVFFSVPLVIYVICERADAILLPYFHPAMTTNARLNYFWIILTRTIILSISLLTAMLVPHFALLMGLVGSITGTFLSFIFPCWFHIVVKRESLTRLGIAIRVIIGVLGSIFGLVGAVFSAKEIVAKYTGT